VAHIASLDGVDARISAFDTARLDVAGAASVAGASIQEATADLAAASLVRSIASAAVPKPTVLNSALDLGIQPLQSTLNEFMAPLTGVFNQAADAYRVSAMGMLSSLVEAHRQPLLEAIQGFAEFNMPLKINQPLIQPEWMTAMSSALVGRAMFDALKSSTIFNALRNSQSVSADLLRFSDSLAPYTDSW